MRMYNLDWQAAWPQHGAHHMRTQLSRDREPVRLGPYGGGGRGVSASGAIGGGRADPGDGVNLGSGLHRIDEQSRSPQSIGRQGAPVDAAGHSQMRLVADAAVNGEREQPLMASDDGGAKEAEQDEEPRHSGVQRPSGSGPSLGMLPSFQQHGLDQDGCVTPNYIPGGRRLQSRLGGGGSVFGDRCSMGRHSHRRSLSGSVRARRGGLLLMLREAAQASVLRLLGPLLHTDHGAERPSALQGGSGGGLVSGAPSPAQLTLTALSLLVLVTQLGVLLLMWWLLAARSAVPTAVSPGPVVLPAHSTSHAATLEALAVAQRELWAQRAAALKAEMAGLQAYAEMLAAQLAAMTDNVGSAGEL
jgi:hypothetical protein